MVYLFQCHTAENKLISWPGLEKSFYGSSYAVGEPVNLTKLFHFTGVNPQNGFPTFSAKDASGIPNYSTDRVIAPVGTPYFGGMNNDFTYRQWTLGFFIQFFHQNGFNNVNSYSPLGSVMANQNRSVLNRWQKPGDTNT
jgi:hypothetical protein